MAANAAEAALENPAGAPAVLAPLGDQSQSVQSVADATCKCPRCFRQVPMAKCTEKRPGGTCSDGQKAQIVCHECLAAEKRMKRLGKDGLCDFDGVNMLDPDEKANMLVQAHSLSGQPLAALITTCVSQCHQKVNERRFKLHEDFGNENKIRDFFKADPDTRDAILALQPPDTIVCKHTKQILYPMPTYTRSNENIDNVAEKRERTCDVEEKIKAKKAAKLAQAIVDGKAAAEATEATALESASKGKGKRETKSDTPKPLGEPRQAQIGKQIQKLDEKQLWLQSKLLEGSAPTIKSSIPTIWVDNGEAMVEALMELSRLGNRLLTDKVATKSEMQNFNTAKSQIDQATTLGERFEGIFEDLAAKTGTGELTA